MIYALRIGWCALESVDTEIKHLDNWLIDWLIDPFPIKATLALVQWGKVAYCIMYTHLMSGVLLQVDIRTSLSQGPHYLHIQTLHCLCEIHKSLYHLTASFCELLTNLSTFGFSTS